MAKRGAGGNTWHGHFEPKRVPEGVWMRCDRCRSACQHPYPGQRKDEAMLLSVAA